MKGWVFAVWLGVWGSTTWAADRIHSEEEDRATRVRIESKSKRLIPGETLTLKPGGEFDFKVKCEEQLPSHYRLEIVLLRNEESVAITRILLARNRPLVLQTPEKIWRVWVN